MDSEYVKLYTASGWLNGIMKVTPESICWRDCTVNSPNILEIGSKSIFAAILSKEQKNAFKSVKEAAAHYEPNMKSIYFTIFTVSKVDSNLDFSARNKKRPSCDSWTFQASSEHEANAFVQKIHEIIRPNYKSKPHNILVLLNPNSGKKKSNDVFNTFCKPIFKLSDVNYSLYETTSPEFAKKFMETEDLSKYTTFVSVSGDGLLNQMINGLLSRKDWEKYRKIPFGVVPSGTGNGLAWTFGYGWPELASISIAKGMIAPMDMMAITRANSDPLFCFLSVTWGYVADTDIESEKLRMLGSLRLEAYGILRLLRLRKYEGRIHYLPVEEQSLDKPKIANNEVSEHKTLYATENANASTNSLIDQYVKTQGQHDALSHGLTLPLGGQFTHKPSPLGMVRSPTDSAYNSLTNDSDINNTINGKKENEPVPTSAPAAYNAIKDYLVANQIKIPVEISKLPKDWVTVEGPFTSVTAVKVPWLTKTFLVSDKASIVDGCIDLIWCGGNVSQLKLLPYITDSVKGGFMNKNGINYSKVKAIILEPTGHRSLSKKKSEKKKNKHPSTNSTSTTSISNSKLSNSSSNLEPVKIPGNKGILSFDGEVAPIDYLKIECIPKLINVITNPWFHPFENETKSKKAIVSGHKSGYNNSPISRSASVVSFY
ncbi:hypothetical protein BB558_005924 [Smittium angustum]|uniref:DAGKc domain-containing protein n=1 Tax=Smittium angustum TaxID=133377 RepID=A0A2U1IZ61_SMIAN|nr:hypothetical protein BB558_005924 [Smittium angustum]